MISTLILITIAIFLIFLLLMIWRRGKVDEQELLELGDIIQHESKHALPPSQLISRIFSREDQQFISQLRSPQLQRIYQVERQKVALYWVRRTSHEIGRIMLNHRLTSRRSQDLVVANEAKLLFKYLELRLICGLLIFLIGIFGPHALNDLASHANDLYQSIGRALPDAVVAKHITAPSNLSTP